LSPPIVADTGGLLRGLASTRDGKPSFPEYESVLTSASLVIVPGLVLAEVDYFLRENRVAMRKLVAEIFDPATRYEYELPLPSDIVRALDSAEVKVADLHLHAPTLDDVFLAKTGRSLEGSEEPPEPE